MALDLSWVEQRAKISVPTEMRLYHGLLVKLLGGPSKLLERVTVHRVLGHLRILNPILVSRFFLRGSKYSGELLLSLELEVLLSVLICCKLAFLCDSSDTVTKHLLLLR